MLHKFGILRLIFKVTPSCYKFYSHEQFDIYGQSMSLVIILCQTTVIKEQQSCFPKKNRLQGKIQCHNARQSITLFHALIDKMQTQRHGFHSLHTVGRGEFFQRTEIQSAIAPSNSNSYVNSKRWLLQRMEANTSTTTSVYHKWLLQILPITAKREINNVK